MRLQKKCGRWGLNGEHQTVRNDRHGGSDDVKRNGGTRKTIYTGHDVENSEPMKFSAYGRGLFGMVMTDLSGPLCFVKNK